MNRNRAILRILSSLIVVSFLSACGWQGGTKPQVAPSGERGADVTADQATPGQTGSGAEAVPSRPPRGSLALSVEAGLPAAAVSNGIGLFASVGVKVAPATGETELRLTRADPGEGKLLYERYFVPVDRLSSILDSLTIEEIRAVWTGSGTSSNFGTIYPSAEIVEDLTVALGQPGANVKPQPAAGVDTAIWGDPMGLAIVPFDSLTIRLRALKLDGNSISGNRFEPSTWPLVTRIWASSTTRNGRNAIERLQEAATITNRDAAHLTTLIMTGVTAMARNSAVAMEGANDYGFLARQVGPELAAADLTIISNEIPFVDGCEPNNTLNNLILCSKFEYYENLTLSGVDAIGLSGNHQNDFGKDNMFKSLAFYESKKIPLYGGGANAEAARKPLLLEHNGNRFGFLGANQYGPETYTIPSGEKVSAWAGDDYPGSARFDLATMNADIQALKPQVNLVFAEVQHTEFNDAGHYTTAPIPSQISDFRAMLDAGADIVTGVQAHIPQAVETRKGKLILYGLGNLYFDQTWSWPTSTGLVVRHTIYDGRVINTELLVTVIDKNYQLRWATPQERITVLKTVFNESTWE